MEWSWLGKAGTASKEPRWEEQDYGSTNPKRTVHLGHSCSCETISDWATHCKLYLMYLFCDTAATKKGEGHYNSPCSIHLPC